MSPRVSRRWVAWPRSTSATIARRLTLHPCGSGLWNLDTGRLTGYHRYDTQHGLITWEPLWARTSLEPSRSRPPRSEEHTSELQTLMLNTYALFSLKQKNYPTKTLINNNTHQNK